MTANATVKDSSVTLAVDLEPLFFGTDGGANSFPFANTSKVTLQVGAEPSEAISEIRLATSSIFETAPTLAGVLSSPAFTSLAFGMPMAVRKYCLDTREGKTTSPLFSGIITEINQSIARDMLVVVSKDLRHKLNKLQVIGSFWASGSLSGSSFGIEYRQSEPFICNPDGQPNKLYANHATYGKVPVMCVPNFGVSTSGTIASAEYTRASYWTANDILKALFLMCDSTFCSAVKTAYSWYKTKPDDLKWDIDYANVVDAPKDYLPGSRKEKELRLDGGKVCSLIQNVLNNAGGYSLYCAPNSMENAEQTLKIVRNNYFAKVGTEQKEADGIKLNRLISGPFAQSLLMVNGGEINETADDLYSKVVVAGQPVMIERRLDQETSGGNNALKARWTADDITAMTTYIDSKLAVANADFKRIIQEAFAYFPNVGAAFALDDSYDFTIGTSESSLGTFAKVPRPILPSLLETYKQASSSDTMATLSAYRRPVIVEYYNGTIWLPAGFADGLTIESNGTFWITGLRDQLKTLKFTRLTATTCSITAYKLRVTVAMPCDRRVSYEANTGNAPKIPNDIGRLYPGDEGDTLFVDAGDLYRKEIQRESWPIPETVTDATERGAIAERVLADDSKVLSNGTFADGTTAPIRAHAEAKLADVSRLKRSGGLLMPYIDTHIEPGTAVKEIQNVASGVVSGTYPINAVVSRVVIVNKDGEQHQYIEFAQ